MRLYWVGCSTGISAGRRTPQDTVNVVRMAAGNREHVWNVGDQPSGQHRITARIERRKRRLGKKIRHAVWGRVQDRIAQNQHPLCTKRLYLCDRRRDLLGCTNLDHVYLQAKLRCHGHFARQGQSMVIVGRVGQHRHTLRLRQKLPQNLELLRQESTGCERGHPGDIATWAGKALHQTNLDRTCNEGEGNRDLRRGLLEGSGDRRAWTNDQVRS